MSKILIFFVFLHFFLIFVQTCGVFHLIFANSLPWADGCFIFMWFPPVGLKEGYADNGFPGSIFRFFCRFFLKYIKTCVRIQLIFTKIKPVKVL